MYDNESITDMLDELEDLSHDLTDWETGFVDEMQNAFAENELVTGHQVNKIKEIHARVTGETK